MAATSKSALISYVANFVKIASGKKFNPHVTIGVATIPYLKKMLAEPFEAFTFSPAGASVYQLGTFGTARKELKASGAGALSSAGILFICKVRFWPMLSKKGCELRRTVIPLILKGAASEADHDGAAGPRSGQPVL